MQQNFTCQMVSAENAKCTWSSKVFFCSICFLTIHLLNVLPKRKTKNIFTIMRRMTTAESRRADGPLKQYAIAYVAHPHNPGSLNTCVRNVWKPANDDFSLFRHELRICQQKSWICEHFCEKMVFLSSINTVL